MNTDFVGSARAQSVLDAKLEPRGFDLSLGGAFMDLGGLAASWIYREVDI